MITKDHILAVVKSRSVVLSAVSIVSAAASSAITYVVLKQRFETKYNKISRTEIEQAKAYYARLNKKDEYSDPIELAKEYQRDEGIDEESEDEDIAESLREFQSKLTGEGYAYQADTAESYSSVVVAPPDLVVVPKKKPRRQNVFSDASEADFIFEEEVRNRTPDVPYVISQDEFIACEKDYSQMTITYFDGDDVLVDEKDQPIRDIDETIGLGNLARFGHGSGSPAIVYIRNEELEIEFEVLKSEGEYAKEVLGYIRHSNWSAKTRKFRSDDE